VARISEQILPTPRRQAGAQDRNTNEERYRQAVCRSREGRAQAAGNSVHPGERIGGRIHVEKINEPFLSREGPSPAEYKAGLDLAIARGWLWKHESGTYVKFTPAGAELLPRGRSNSRSREAAVPTDGALSIPINASLAP
jgi:hypothetical protein